MKLEDRKKPFENYLKMFMVSDYNQLSNTFEEREAKELFESPITTELSADKVSELLERLNLSVSKDTLGALIGYAVTDKGISQEEIYESTGLSHSTLQDLTADNVFTNSIPVRSLVKLVKLLGLSLEKINAAIEQTFDQLTIESSLMASNPVNFKPSYRKSGRGNVHEATALNKRTSESYLYQNKEALDKYIKRFSELYSER